MCRAITLLCSLLLVLKQLSGTSAGALSHSKSSIILSVKRTLICAEAWESVKISCSLTTRNGNAESTKYWSLSWFSEERRIWENTTVERLKNNSILTSCLNVYVSGRHQKTFTCVGSRLVHPKNGNLTFFSKSVVIRTKPQSMSRIIGFRFREKDPVNMFEIFWRPAVDSNRTVYTLKYCPENGDEDRVCPRNADTLLKGQCGFHMKNYYNMPNTTGLICKTEFPQTASVYTVYKLYVVAQDDAGCERIGDEHRFQLAFWRDPNPNPNITEVILVPYPVINLYVTSTKRRQVRVVWSDPWFVLSASSRKYTVDYKCMKSDIWARTESSRTKVTLMYNDFYNYQPYDLCQFCITAKPFRRGIESKPVCVFTRLHEEVPEGAPRVTCIGSECASTSEGDERNVTITWKLPPRGDWNGVLTNLKIIYRYLGDAYRSPAEILVTNLTAGETVLTGLAGNKSYVVQMVACNKEGCGSVGNSTDIPALMVRSPRKRLRSVIEWGIIPVTVVGCIVGLLFIFLAIYILHITWNWIQKRSSEKLSFLPSIFEPSTYEHVLNREGDNTAEYKVLDELQHDEQENSLFVNVKKDGILMKYQSQPEKANVIITLDSLVAKQYCTCI